jgi:hypothetical protein
MQAFSTILDRALSGAYANISADDIRAVVALVYLSGNPDFPALNDALYTALNGNASALSYDIPTFTQQFAQVMPIACLDAREPLVLREPNFSTFSTAISG